MAAHFTSTPGTALFRLIQLLILVNRMGLQTPPVSSWDLYQLARVGFGARVQNSGKVQGFIIRRNIGRGMGETPDQARLVLLSIHRCVIVPANKQ